MRLSLLIFLAAPLHCLYTSEPTVKLLTVQQFGNNFPAAESEYRTEVTGGRVRYNFSKPANPQLGAEIALISQLS